MFQNPKDTYKKHYKIMKNKEEIRFITYPESIEPMNPPTELYVEHTLDIKTGNLKIKTYDDHEYFNSNTDFIPKWINHGIVVNLKEKYPDIYSKLLEEKTTEIIPTTDFNYTLQKLFFNEINNKLKYPLFDYYNNEKYQKEIWTKGSKEKLIQDLTYFINKEKNIKKVKEWPIVIELYYETSESQKILYKIEKPSNFEISLNTKIHIENTLKNYAFEGHYYKKNQDFFQKNHYYSQRAYNFEKIKTTHLNIYQLTSHQILDAGLKGKLL